MPKERTHWILAEKAYQGIEPDSPLKKIVRSCKHLYLMGAVILDTPFYQFYGRNRKFMDNLGEQLHDHPSNSYTPIVRGINSYDSIPPDNELSLLLGMISHIHLDSTFHPFIYYFTENYGLDKKSRQKAMSLHRILETHLDIYYSKDQSIRSFYEILKNVEMDRRTLLHFLSFIFGTDTQKIQHALKSHAFIQKQFENHKIESILNLLSKIPGIDLSLYLSPFYPRQFNEFPLFSCPFSYQHPVTGEKFYHSIKELEQKAIQAILDIFKIIEYHISKNSLRTAFSYLTGPNLYTGIPGKQKSDMKYFSSQKKVGN